MTNPLRSVAAAAAAALAVAGAAVTVVLSAARGGGAPWAELVAGTVIGMFAGVGMMIAIARPEHRVGRVLLAGAAAWGVGESALGLAVEGLVTAPGSVPAAAWLAVAGTLLRGVGWFLLVLALPVMFPDGNRPPAPWRWTVPVTVAVLATFVGTVLVSPTVTDVRLTDVANPAGLPPQAEVISDVLFVVLLVLMLAGFVGVVGSLVARWRMGGPLLRQQLLWFAWAAALPTAVIPLMAVGAAPSAAFSLSVLPVPIAIGVAVLQHRLYDVHLVINRTIVSLTLSAAIAGLYVLVVGGVGALLQVRGATWLPWLAAGAVAVAFAPLRQSLQRAANRLTYGQWSRPEAMLAAVRRRIVDAADGERLLRTVVTELGERLDLAHLSILDVEGCSLAGYGAPTDEDNERALTAYGRPVGVLRWSAGKRELRPTDQNLLGDLADQLGLLVHAAALVRDLRHAHEDLIPAREEERRRLRRDLHDGLGPALAGLTLKVEAARNLVSVDAEAAESVLRDLRSGIQATVLDVRRVVQGLRPPALDELGLAGAVVDLAARLGQDTGTRIEVDLPGQLSPLTAAAEIAAYRVTQEALTNAVRHAAGAPCRVAIRDDPQGLCIEVADAGDGRVAVRPEGAGLATMRERAEQIGGELTIVGEPGRGTTVRLRLPSRADVAAPTEQGAAP